MDEARSSSSSGSESSGDDGNVFPPVSCKLSCRISCRELTRAPVIFLAAWAFHELNKALARLCSGTLPSRRVVDTLLFASERDRPRWRVRRRTRVFTCDDR